MGTALDSSPQVEPSPALLEMSKSTASEASILRAGGCPALPAGQAQALLTTFLALWSPFSTILTPFRASTSNVCLGWGSPVGRLLFPGIVGSLAPRSIHEDHQQDSARHGGEALGA